MKYIESFFGICLLVIIVPILVALTILALPMFAIGSVFNKIENSYSLWMSLKRNHGRIFFIYADYNNFDFSEIFATRYPSINCVKTKNWWEHNLLIKYLTKDCISKSYPRLVKIDRKKLMTKVHYNSFKYYYKKNDEIEGFMSLLEKSIKNLENEN